jgi:hypothetical protein
MIVSPYDFSGFGMFFRGLPITDGVEHLRTCCDNQARHPDIGRQILAADRHCETETDRIVEIDDRMESRK